MVVNFLCRDLARIIDTSAVIVQQVLSEHVGKQVLARHLDADEAVALGAALQAANLSDGIKLNRKIGMLDGTSYGIELQLDGASLDPADSYSLVARLKKLPSKVSYLPLKSPICRATR